MFMSIGHAVATCPLRWLLAEAEPSQEQEIADKPQFSAARLRSFAGNSMNVVVVGQLLAYCLATVRWA